LQRLGLRGLGWDILSARGTEVMTKFTKLFPFKHEGKMPTEDCRKGARLLREVKPLEGEAITHMKQALRDWEAS